jgi:transmembrane sensor
MKLRIGWRAIARYFAGEADARERATIESWANEDPARAELLRDAGRAWDAAPATRTQWNVDAAWQKVAGELHDGVVRKPTRKWLWPAAAAAVLLLVGVPLVWRELAPSHEQTYATGAGEQRTVRLADGSVVHLAANTRLHVASNRPREVRLEGTAFFGITERDEPFTVRAGAGEARVLGTRFELRTTGDRLRLAVLEGRVALKTDVGQERIVEAGQVSSGDARHLPSAPQRADVQQMLGWMGKVLIFQDTPLRQAVQEVERLYGFDIRITAASLNDRTVTATFENENASNVLTTLCRVVDARCDLQDRVVLIGQ